MEVLGQAGERKTLDGANRKAEKYSLSIVIPVYRSEKILSALVKHLAAVLPRLTEKFELILVNDGSPDDSWRVIQQLTETYKWVRGFSLMRNYGQHNALLCGIRAAENEIIVTMDDDLQHPPEEISKLLEQLTGGCDVVYGTPRADNHSLWRNLTSETTKIVLQNAMGANVARRVSAFRAFRASLRNAFADYRGSFVSIDILLTWGTTKFTAVSDRCSGR